jgi:hypothetical protein
MNIQKRCERSTVPIGLKAHFSNQSKIILEVGRVRLSESSTCYSTAVSIQTLSCSDSDDELLSKERSSPGSSKTSEIKSLAFGDTACISRFTSAYKILWHDQ